MENAKPADNNTILQGIDNIYYYKYSVSLNQRFQEALLKFVYSMLTFSDLFQKVLQSERYESLNSVRNFNYLIFYLNHFTFLPENNVVFLTNLGYFYQELEILGNHCYDISIG